MKRLLQGIGFFFLFFSVSGTGMLPAQHVYANWTWIDSFSPEDALIGRKIIEDLGSLEKQLEVVTEVTEAELREYRLSFEHALILYDETVIEAEISEAAGIEKEFSLSRLRDRVETGRQALERGLIEYSRDPVAWEEQEEEGIVDLKARREDLLSRLSSIILRNLPEPADPFYPDFNKDLLLFYRDTGLSLTEVDRLVEEMIERSRSFTQAEKIKEYLQKLSPLRFQTGETDLVALRYRYEILVEQWWSSVLALLDPDALLNELEDQAENLFSLSPELSRKVRLHYEELSALRMYQREYETLIEESFDAVLLPVLLGGDEYGNSRNELKYFIETSALPLIAETGAAVSGLPLSSPLLTHYAMLWRIFDGEERFAVVRMLKIPRLLPEIAWAACEKTLLSEYRRKKLAAERLIAAASGSESSPGATDQAFSVLSQLRTFFSKTVQDTEGKRWRVLQLLSDPAAQIHLRDSGDTDLMHKVRAYLSEIYEETDQSLIDKIEGLSTEDLEEKIGIDIEDNAAVIVKIDAIDFPALPFDRTVSIEIELLTEDGENMPLSADLEWLAGMYYDSFQQATLRSVPSGEEGSGRQSADWSRMHGQSVVRPLSQADYTSLTGSLVEGWLSASRLTEDPELESDFRFRAYLQLLRIFRQYLQLSYERNNIDYRCYMNDYHVFLAELLERLDLLEIDISRFEELLREYTEKKGSWRSDYLGRHPVDYAVSRFNGYAAYIEKEVSDISRYLLIRDLYRRFRRIEEEADFWMVFRRQLAGEGIASVIGEDLYTIFVTAADSVFIQNAVKKNDLDVLYSQLDVAVEQNIITRKAAIELGKKGEAAARRVKEGEN